VGPLQQVRLQELLRHGRPPAQQVDPVRRGRHALRKDLLAEEGVDEAGLARVELPDDDQQEELVELDPGLAEVAEILVGDIRPERLQGVRQPLEQLLLPRP
jgi:hypothetical protein